MEVQGLNALLANLKSKVEQSRRDDGVVIVGYTQNYAIYVHENLTARHRVGQAKFLERPAREMAREIVNIVATAVRRGAQFIKGLLLAGLRLQRESQLLCPVDTGSLRNSAFTRRE